MHLSRSSSRFSQSPTVVQSPDSLGSNWTSLPMTPVLQVEVDRRPFSKSFPEIIKDHDTDHLATSSCTSIKHKRKNSCRIISRSDSFHIESYRNIKGLDPHWDDDEIEEIMVISPKSKARTSFLDLSSGNRPNVNDFEVLRVLGKESSMQTILARSFSDNGIYAIKTLGKRASAPSTRHIRSEQKCLRIVTESSRPFLPKLHRSFQDEARLYMVLNTYPGGSIALHLDREGTFSPDKALFYASELVEAISYLHSKRIIHRDIKPENIMIDSDGHIVLTNFACAKLLENYESTGSSCGTKEYEAPERILNWAYDFAVDIWSFGIILCIMHFGQHPFIGGDELDPLLIMQKRILRGQIPSHPPQFIPLSEWSLIKSCLERNPLLRPGVESLRTHEYFLHIDWEDVKKKEYPAPYIPFDNEIEVEVLEMDRDEDGLHEDVYRECKETLNDSPVSEASDIDDFSYDWDPTSSSSEGNESFKISRDKVKSAPHDVRGILKSPSTYFPGDHINPSQAASETYEDFLNMCSSSRLSITRTSVRPRKLRKARLSGTGSRSSVLQNRKSMVSIISEMSKNRLARKTSSNKLLRGLEGSVSSETPNLPKGIVQKGRGIGFTYLPQGTQSRVSLSSATAQTCFKRIVSLVNWSTLSSRSTSKKDVMQQVYGSTWSIQTDTRMSSVSLAMPDGLGRQV